MSMKTRKELESFSENKNLKEEFRFNKEQSNLLNNEDFVYKFEDNKISWTNEVSTSGSEESQYTSKFEEAQADKQKELEDALEKSSSSSSSSSSSVSSSSSSATASNSAASGATASTSSVVHTVAITATTAVVAVVGGGMIINNEVLDKINICRVNEVVETYNSISFNVAIGDKEEDLHGSNEKCSVVVELECLSYNEEPRTDETIKTFGTYTVTFSDLTPDCDYSINVYQNQLLETSRTYLLNQPIVVRTRPQDRITYRKTMDVFEHPVYYADVSIKTIDLSIYQYLYIGVYDKETLVYPNYDDIQPGDEPEMEGFYTSADVDYTVQGWQKLNWKLPELERYYCALIGETGIGDEEPVILMGQFVDFNNMEISEYESIQNEFYMYRSYKNGNPVYTAMVGCVNTTYYENPYVTATNMVDTSENPITFGMREFNVKTKLEQVSLGMWVTYNFEVFCTSHKPEDVAKWNEEHQDSQATVDAGVEIKLYETKIDLYNVYEEEMRSRILYRKSLDVFGHDAHYVSIEIDDMDLSQYENLYIAAYENEEDAINSQGDGTMGGDPYAIAYVDYSYDGYQRLNWNQAMTQNLVYCALMGKLQDGTSDGHVVFIRGQYVAFDNMEYYEVESIQDQFYAYRSTQNETNTYYAMIGCTDTTEYDSPYIVFYPYYYGTSSSLRTSLNAGSVNPFNQKVAWTIEFGNNTEYDIYGIDVYCVSHRQEDVDAYNAEFPGSEHTVEDGVDKLLYTTVIDFNYMYQEVLPDRSYVNDVYFNMYANQYGGEEYVFAAINAHDPEENLFDYHLEFVNKEDETKTYVVSMEQASFVGNGEIYRLLLDDIYTFVGYDYYFTLYGIDMAVSAEEKQVLYTGEASMMIQSSLYNGCAQILVSEDMTAGRVMTMMINMDYDWYDKYDQTTLLRVEFTLMSGSHSPASVTVSGVDANTQVTIDGMSVNTDIWHYQVYGVSLETGLEVLVYEETLNFANII